MTTSSDLIAAIRANLGPSVTPNFSSAANASDIFEAYILCLIVEAARTENATVYYRDVFGKSVTQFVFRASPGYIFSTAQPYTHAVLTFPGKPPLEAHIGVRVVGKSDVLHECDVAVIDQMEAETCRRSCVSPRSSKVLIAVECKFYSTVLPLHLGRSFIGLTSDLSAKNAVFATNSKSDSIEKLLTARKQKWEHGLTPRMTREVSRLRAQFQEAFKLYQAD